MIRMAMNVSRASPHVTAIPKTRFGQAPKLGFLEDPPDESGSPSVLVLLLLAPSQLIKLETGTWKTALVLVFLTPSGQYDIKWLTTVLCD